ncbi:PMS1 protein homolog 1-like [Penaeus chinensis]|uniref:PMS1 protein homolog 1-like n=1 Tax=Penaeus chinensis TaxID=139456 RepID=UPI001FB5A76C|nr:PMS1 protein homolog 1-like [Penaeus chinensis]XP_047472034.1 PMS1 protein homolog 1-like [Penaeus chinensis]
MALCALPADTIRLIKSTQVITTPVSIVKELLENAVDAEASTVSVRLENYGFVRLEVRDNGKGISEEDIKVVAKPHFTSKISSFADLSSLTSYGFRGEALSSLCAVADVTITTKTKESSMGHIYTFTHQGDVATKKPAATPKGTSIVVSNLFKNVPVRRQYYNNPKRRKEELKKVEDLMLSFCIAAPEVHLTLVHEKNTMIQKNSAKGIQHSLMNIFPTVYKKLKAESKEVEGVKLEVYLPDRGFCADQATSRSCADRLFVIVNRRPVSHKSMEKMVKAHFSQASEGCHGRYPIGVISLVLSPDDLDVNLEPNKNKVLLKDEETALESLKEILENIYGPLETTKKPSHKKNGSESVAADTDITCTLACVTQKQGSDSNSRNELEILDEFLAESLKEEEKQEEQHVKAADGCKLEERLSKDYCIYNDKENDNFFENCNLTPSNVDNRTTRPMQVKDSPNPFSQPATRDEQYSHTPLRDKVLKLAKPDDESRIETVSRSYLTSTQDSKSHELGDRRLPSLSLSTIHSEGSTPKKHNAGDDNLSFICPSENTFSFSSNSSKKSSHIEGRQEVSSEDFDKSMDIASHKDENKHTQQSPSKDLSSQLHKTVVGDDGVPVFQIKPLEMNDISESSSDLVQPLQNANKVNLSSREVQQDLSKGSESAVTSRTEVQEKQISLTTEKEKSNLAGSWSRGHLTMGGNIQTVQIVTPKIQEDHVQETPVTTNAFKRLQPPSPGKQLSPVPSKKMKHESLSPTSYEYVQGKSVKRPASAFILYSRDIRRTVLRENPGKDFAFIARAMADRWKVADADTKEYYKGLSNEESRRYQEEIRKIREKRSHNDSIFEKSNISRATLDKFMGPLTPVAIKDDGKRHRKVPENVKCPSSNKTKNIEVDIEKIKQQLKKRSSQANSPGPFELIGSLANCGGWLCQEGGTITALNTSRLQETVLSCTLLNTFNLTPKELKDSIPFNASTIGTQEWTSLANMSMSLEEDRNFYVVNDRRLLSNGFKVVLYPASNSSVLSHGEIVGMADCIGFYGLNDLKEILTVITSNPTASLGKSRPLKLQHWLKGETVRMIRSGPNLKNREDVSEKLRQWQKMQGIEAESICPSSWIKQKCLHNKLIFTPVYSLDDIPSTPSQNSEL